MKNQKSFKGKIKFISCSPHGDPEGIVLADGTFVKAPPHSLQSKELFTLGAEVSGTGELLAEDPNRVFHHAKITKGKSVLSDDSVDADQREDLKKQHKKDLEKRKDSPSKKLTIQGKVAAIATKPKGEVDRLILDDGTSVHVPKEVEIYAKNIDLGDSFEIRGEARDYDKLKFMRAEKVRAL